MTIKFIIAVITAEPEHVITVRDALQSAVPLVRLEKGCIQYDLYEDTLNKARFIMIERWSDEQALLAHTKANPFITLSRILDARANLEIMDIGAVDLAH